MSSGFQQKSGHLAKQTLKIHVDEWMNVVEVHRARASHAWMTIQRTQLIGSPMNAYAVMTSAIRDAHQERQPLAHPLFKVVS